MSNKNIRYITLLLGFVMTLLRGFGYEGLYLFYFGGAGDNGFRFALEEDFIVVVAFFTPYILAKIWQSYTSELK